MCIRDRYNGIEIQRGMTTSSTAIFIPFMTRELRMDGQALYYGCLLYTSIGYLFWGGVGTGKSYLAACIANALMEKEVAVCMTNFATILNDLAASFEGRNEYISRLCSYPLLILDDFGMERGTEYGLEQVYSVIDLSLIHI